MQSRGESSSSSNSSYSPSFNSYFNHSLTQIAVRVCHELIDEESEFVAPVPVEFSSFRFSEDDSKRNDSTAVYDGGDSFDAVNKAEDENEENDDNDSFEFEFNISSSLLSLEGENVVGPIYPVFDRSLLKDLESNNNYSKRNNDEAAAEKSDVLIPLKSLFLQDQTFELEQPSSSSSSEADELEAIPAGTYCVWTPQSPSYRCTKSNSTGSTTSSSTVAAALLPSKTWRLRNLLRRSKSDGKEGLVLLGPPQPSTNNKKKEEEMRKNKVNYEKSVKGTQQQQQVVKKNTTTTTAARGGYYGKRNGITGSQINREGGGGREFSKRKSYLPYRQDLVGLFASPHGHGMRKMSLPPF